MLLTCPVRVDLAATNAEIASGFDKWLIDMRNRFKSWPRPQPRKNANSALRTALKDLGMLRLVTQMKAPGAIRHTNQFIRQGSMYERPSHVSRAKKRALKIIELWSHPEIARQLLLLKSSGAGNGGSSTERI